MICTEIDDRATMDAMGRSLGPRSVDTLHLSQIIKAINVRKDPVRFDPFKPMDMLKIELGFSIEAAIEEGLAIRFPGILRPGEVTLPVRPGDPRLVHMSPDGANPDLIAGEEFKATYMSSRAGLLDEYGMFHEKFEHWGWQIKGYAKALEVNDYILRVVFLAGDYSKPIRPIAFTHTGKAGYLLHFEDEELDENWEFLMREGEAEGLL